MKLVIASLSVALLFSISAPAKEPAYCDPAKIDRYEVRENWKSKPTRGRVFRFGSVTVAGLNIGGSGFESTRLTALRYGRFRKNQNFCSFFVGSRDDGKANQLVWNRLFSPHGDPDQVGDEFMATIGHIFDKGAANFVDCAVNSGYIAVGCDSQMHRAPSVFAMLLAYSGCTPEHATDIVNHVWGENGIDREMRVGLAARAAKLATEHPDQSRKLRRAFTRRR